MAELEHGALRDRTLRPRADPLLFDVCKYTSIPLAINFS